MILRICILAAVSMTVATASTTVSATAATTTSALPAATVDVSQAMARATAPGQTSAAVYLTLSNRGARGDQLISVRTPVAQHATVHTMSMQGDMMKMREVRVLELPPHQSIAMSPGAGYHIMLTGLQQPMIAGRQFTLTLRFALAGTITVPVRVDAVSAR